MRNEFEAHEYGGGTFDYNVALRVVNNYFQNKGNYCRNTKRIVATLFLAKKL